MDHAPASPEELWQLSFPATQNDPQQAHLRVRASVPADGILDEMHIATASLRSHAVAEDGDSDLGSEPWLEA